MTTSSDRERFETMFRGSRERVEAALDETKHRLLPLGFEIASKAELIPDPINPTDYIVSVVWIKRH